jgi:hypothetical protein
MFSQDFSCPDLLNAGPLNNVLVYGIITLYDWSFHTILLTLLSFTPAGLIRVRSPLLTESHLISFPPGT